ncbi:aminodeoxychorismate synthase component I [Nocardia fluminea]|uniref:aminodeoxychorismate synthase component I n=1 Tax=Nocardia fluminea TaxID=134984 RepID=UPI00364FDCC5
MRVLLIDNHDSYTYNLFQLIASTYGVEPAVFTNDDPALRAVDAADYDAVVLSPGPGRPQTARDVGAGPDLVRELGLPVLGVCLGHQVLGMVTGACVQPAPQPRHGYLESVTHDGTGLFHGLPQGFTAVRYHSLCVADPVPDELEVTARGADGVIMALRHRNRPWWGVQFHPESVATEYGARLLENFRHLAMKGHAADQASHTGWRVHANRARTGSAGPSAERLFEELFGSRPFAFWLDSSRVEPGLSRWSFLGDAGGPCGEVLTAEAGRNALQCQKSDSTTVEHASIFDALRTRLADRAGVVDPSLPVTPAGGYVGWFGYEMKAESGSPNRHAAATPDAVWMSASRLLAVDHQADAWWVLGLCDGDPQHCAQVRAWVEEVTAVVETSSSPADPVALPTAAVDPEPWLNRSREHYVKEIAQCQQALRVGESYEICLTAELELPFQGDPLTVYRRLRRLNPAPYSAYLRAGDVHVLSSSPERFLCVDRDGIVESKPIKGTAPRAADPVRDAHLRTELAASAKTRAENLMIVDLVRNDLGRVSVAGSVEVPKLMHVETYATVHQLVSTVRGRLRTGQTALDAVRACFPGGSMTGAPKERTMEIIGQLEDRARGVYSGTLGFLEPGGAADLDIVIRTIVLTEGRLTIGTGGAIVLDSDPDDEFDEILVKAAASLRAVAPEEVGQPGSIVPEGDSASPAATAAKRSTKPRTQASSKRSLA